MTKATAADKFVALSWRRRMLSLPVCSFPHAAFVCLRFLSGRRCWILLIRAWTTRITSFFSPGYEFRVGFRILAWSDHISFSSTVHVRQLSFSIHLITLFFSLSPSFHWSCLCTGDQSQEREPFVGLTQATHHHTPNHHPRYSPLRHFHLSHLPQKSGCNQGHQLSYATNQRYEAD